MDSFKTFFFLFKEIEKLSLVERYQTEDQIYHSLLLEKMQNHSMYKENQISNLFLLMLNLQQDSREKQTQQKEESGKLSAVTGIWIVTAIP